MLRHRSSPNLSGSSDEEMAKVAKRMDLDGTDGAPDPPSSEASTPELQRAFSAPTGATSAAPFPPCGVCGQPVGSTGATIYMAFDLPYCSTVCRERAVTNHLASRGYS